MIKYDVLREMIQVYDGMEIRERRKENCREVREEESHKYLIGSTDFEFWNYGEKRQS